MLTTILLLLSIAVLLLIGALGIGLLIGAVSRVIVPPDTDK